MSEPVLSWFVSSGFMPHGHCFLWTPSLLWLYITSDLAIGAAYYSIPLALVYFVRKRRDLQFDWIFILFSLFIFACGTTHLISIWTIWNPDYWLDAWVKAITAVLSMVTAILLWHLIPTALRVPSPERLRAAISQMEHEVSERKQAEAALAQLNDTLEQRVAARTAELQAINARLASEIDSRKRAEERFRRVVEYAPNGMVMISRDGTIVMVNRQTEEIFQYERAELLGKSIEQLVPARFRDHHPDLRDTYSAAPKSRPMGEGRELYGVRRDESEVPVEIALNPVETDEGTMILAAIVDISDRKLKEDRIRASLKEKITLLAEVHHRVKNNLQIVHSLLDLQASQTADATARETLESCKHRIQSMSLIHQSLYQSNHFDHVNLNEVLTALAANVSMSYGVENERVQIAMQVEESISLPMTQAIPCGLIVNELVTNALKYAFPNRMAGEIRVGLVRAGEDKFVLSVTDNGIGLPEGLDLNNIPSLGLELVSVLTEQLHGELIIHHANPTRFEVHFHSTGQSLDQEQG